MSSVGLARSARRADSQWKDPIGAYEQDRCWAAAADAAERLGTHLLGDSGPPAPGRNGPVPSTRRTSRYSWYSDVSLRRDWIQGK